MTDTMTDLICEMIGTQTAILESNQVTQIQINNLQKQIEKLTITSNQQAKFLHLITADLKQKRTS